MPSATRNFQQNDVQGKDKLLQPFEGKVAIKISRNCEWKIRAAPGLIFSLSIDYLLLVHTHTLLVIV